MSAHEPLLFWGTYDRARPRIRLLLEAARAGSLSPIECHAEIWRGFGDRSAHVRWGSALRIGFRYLRAYPGLIFRFLRGPRVRTVVVAYPGLVDVLVLWPFARWRGTRICWDVFISAYDTIVRDRGLLDERHPASRLLKRMEALASRLADIPLLDTKAHATYFDSLFAVPSGKTRSVWVGAEPGIFFPRPARKASAETRVLFYGTFIPLHGTETIVRAARLLEDRDLPVKWIVVGGGQDRPRVDALTRELGVTTIERHPWVPYEELGAWIAGADIVLGIFGDTEKASRVIPNKVFQTLAAGKPLITRDSPAVREILPSPPDSIRLIPPADAAALADAVLSLARGTVAADYPRVDPVALAPQLVEALASGSA